MPFLLSRKNKSVEVKVRLSELSNGRHPDAPSRQSVGKTEEEREENSHLLFTCTCKTLAVSRPSERRHQIPLWRPLARSDTPLEATGPRLPVCLPACLLLPVLRSLCKNPPSPFSVLGCPGHMPEAQSFGFTPGHSGGLSDRHGTLVSPITTNT